MIWFTIVFTIIVAGIIGVCIFDMGIIVLNALVRRSLHPSNQLHHNNNQQTQNSKPNNTTDYPPYPNRPVYHPINYDEYDGNGKDKQAEFPQISPILIRHLTHIISRLKR